MYKKKEIPFKIIFQRYSNSMKQRPVKGLRSALKAFSILLLGVLAYYQCDATMRFILSASVSSVSCLETFQSDNISH